MVKKINGGSAFDLLIIDIARNDVFRLNLLILVAMLNIDDLFYAWYIKHRILEFFYECNIFVASSTLAT